MDAETHVTVSPEAAERIRAALAEETNATDAGLRIDVVPGGCSGHQYRLALDRTQEDDWVGEQQDVRVLVATSALRYVTGARVECDTRGFRIDNPNVDYSCGCGSSFQLREEADAVSATG
jgi:iron-sulfur cluster assembly protein